MLLAKPQDGGVELYCGMFAGHALFASGNETRQWICLEDTDGDLVFETAYQAPFNNGSFLPAFDRVTSPRAVSGPYRLDPKDDRFGFEVGLVYEPTKARSGLGDVVEKVRTQGDDSWSDMLTGSVQSLTGYSTWISGMDFPEDVSLDRARFIVTGGDRHRITVEPQNVSTGEVGFTVRRCSGFGLKC